MSLINQTPNGAVDEQSPLGVLVGVTTGWRNFFNSVFNICNALTMSGTTAHRPTVGLWVGRTYFDVTIGRPIFYNGAIWINAAGAPV